MRLVVTSSDVTQCVILIGQRLAPGCRAGRLVSQAGRATHRSYNDHWSSTGHAPCLPGRVNGVKWTDRRSAWSVVDQTS